MKKLNKVNDRTGYLYIICAYDNAYDNDNNNNYNIKSKYKIGRSIKVPNRLNALQTANADKLLVTRKYTCMNVVKLEKIVHEQFKEYKIRGEWFSFNEDELDMCIKFAKQENKKINNEYNEDLKIIKYIKGTINRRDKCDWCLFKANKFEDFVEHLKSETHREIMKQIRIQIPVHISLRLDRLLKFREIEGIKPELDKNLIHKELKDFIRIGKVV